MFIELTDLAGKKIYVNTDKIMWIAPNSERGYIESSFIAISDEAWVKASESPDMIMKLIERSKNGT